MTRQNRRTVPAIDARVPQRDEPVTDRRTDEVSLAKALFGAELVGNANRGELARPMHYMGVGMGSGRGNTERSGGVDWGCPECPKGC